MSGVVGPRPESIPYPYLVQPGVPAFTGLLDTYSGAAVAYSAARRLSSTYTGNLIRVRRSSDNTEQDIGYDGSNVLDESALTTFVGANNGFVVKFYDQSGNGYNLEQTTAANQPKIVSSGTVNKLNSKPSLNFDGSNDGLAVTDNTILHASALTSCFYVTYLNSSGSNNAIASKSYNSDGGYFFGGYASFDQIQEWLDNVFYGPHFSGIQNTQLLFTNINKTGSSGIKIYKNSTTSVSNTATTDLTGTNSYYFTVGKDANAAIYLTGEIQEIVIYSSDQTTDRTNIESNINTFYSIY